MKVTTSLSLLALLLVAGCGDTKDPAANDTTGGSTATATVDGSGFVLDAEPDSPSSVLKLREEAKDGDDIVIVGRIGGSANPWIDGRAVFSLVDCSAVPCNEIEGDACPVPWDYCCETDLAKKTTLVKFLSDEGKPLAAGAKELFSVKELDTVVITGKAKRDDAGNLTVLAAGMFVRKAK